MPPFTVLAGAIPVLIALRFDARIGLGSRGNRRRCRDVDRLLAGARGDDWDFRRHRADVLRPARCWRCC